MNLGFHAINPPIPASIISGVTSISSCSSVSFVAFAMQVISRSRMLVRQPDNSRIGEEAWLVEIASRRMGIDNGKDTLVHVDQILERALAQMEARSGRRPD
jgi:hypothetical protein